MEKLIKKLWAIFLFIFPFSIRRILFDELSYRTGNFNPWVTVFVYLPEILLLAIFVLWIINSRKSHAASHKSENEFQGQGLIPKSKNGWMWGLFALFILNAFAVSLFSALPILGGIFVLRIFEGLIVYWLITEKLIEPKKAVTILIFGALFQMGLGFIQWVMNHSVGLKILGESVIGPDILNVAKNDSADGLKHIRAYGTFLHPNIFAAYLLIVFLLAAKYLKSGSKVFWLIVFSAGILLTGSRAAMAVCLVSVFLYILFAVIKATPLRRTIGILVIIFLVIGNLWYFTKSGSIKTSDASFAQRLAQNDISKNMWKSNPLGVGIGAFTLQMEKYTDGGANCGQDSGSNGGGDCGKRLMPWEFQPVHNTFFLILNETGIQGILILLIFLIGLFDMYWREGKGIAVIALLLMAPFDHFLWDSWSGMIIIALVAGFFALENRMGIIEKIEEKVS